MNLSSFLDELIKVGFGGDATAHTEAARLDPVEVGTRLPTVKPRRSMIVPGILGGVTEPSNPVDEHGKKSLYR